MIEQPDFEGGKLSYTQPGHKITGLMLKYLHNKPGRGKLIKGLIRVFPKLNNAKLIIGQAQLKLDLRNDTEIGYFYGNGIPHERFFRTLLMTLIGPETIFYDIGSNIGYYSFLLFPRVKKVYAFEPNPSLSNQIADVINKNNFSNLAIYNIGLSNHDSVIPFYFNMSQHALGSFIRSSLDDKEMLIQVRTLDSVIKEFELTPPDVLKIDTEGLELDILEGYTQLTTHQPIIFIEWIPWEEDEKSMYERLEKMIGTNYHVFKISLDNKLNPFKLYQPSSNNLLLIPKGSEKLRLVNHWNTQQ